MSGSNKSFETAMRYLAMFNHVPRRPYKITTAELVEKLKGEGFAIDIRSIQRDLNKLSTHFPLEADAGRPAGWCWTDQGPRRSFPHMDLSTALTFELFSRHLAPMLPRKLYVQLKPAFTEARQALDQMRSSPLGKWSRRVAVVPAWQQLLPPEVAGDVIDVVYEALLAGWRFEADYLSVGQDEARRHVINPQGLVYRQGVLYLVASLSDQEKPMQLALHRMRNAGLLGEPAKALKGFDLVRHVEEERVFDIPLGRSIKLELRITNRLARHLGESRLSRDQTIAAIRDSERFRLSATVPETIQLHWWLRSFGPEMEVVKPAALRRKMAQEAADTAALYH